MSNILTSRETPFLEKIELLTMIGIIVSIFFPVRYVLENKFSNILGYYSDFTAISIYASFFLVLLFIGIGIYRSLKSKTGRSILLKILITFIFGLILYQTTIAPDYKIISLYYYLRISCVLLLGYYVYKSPIWLKYRGIMLWTIITLGSIQAIIAMIQFSFQHSLGINILGESPLAVSIYGVAKVVSHGTTFIRGYGTLPHPNILGAFLVITALLNLYLLNESQSRINQILLSITAFFTILGLFVTFSRSALLAVGVGFVTWGVITLFRQKSLLFMRKLWILPLAVIFSTGLFFPWLVSRGNIQDQSASQRAVYNEAGIQILKNNWVIGTGPGTNMFHMKQKLEYQLEPWDIQPIHNYWLITLSELGIIGLFISIFVLFTFYMIIRKSFSRETSGWAISLLVILTSILTLFWFDHYFYTIWPAKLFLWIMIGVIWQAINTVSHETYNTKFGD